MATSLGALNTGIYLGPLCNTYTFPAPNMNPLCTSLLQNSWQATEAWSSSISAADKAECDGSNSKYEWTVTVQIMIWATQVLNHKMVTKLYLLLKLFVSNR